LNQLKYQDIFLRYEAPIKAIRTQTEMLANWWAIQHVELLRYPEEERKWEVVYYEDAVMNPDLHIQMMCDSNGITHKTDERKYRMPSATSQQTVTGTDDYLNNWKSKLDSREIASISEILYAYGLHTYVV